MLPFILSSPLFRFNGFNVSFLDLTPVYFLLILIYRSKYLSFSRLQYIYILSALALITLFLLSTYISFLYFNNDQALFVQLLRLYRRVLAILLLPIIVFLIYDKFSFEKFIQIFSNFIILWLFIWIFQVSIGYDTLNSILDNAGQRITPTGPIRNMGFVGEANYFAFLVAVTILFYSELHDKFKRLKLFLLFVTLISTFSKSIIFSFLGVYIFYYVSPYFKLFILTFMVPPIIFFFDKFRIIYEVSLASFEGRLIFWEQQLSFLTSTNIGYLTGLGFKGQKTLMEGAGSHNNFLAFFYDFGSLSLLVFMFFFFIFFFLIKFSPLQYKNASIGTVFVTIFSSLVHEPMYHFVTLSFVIVIFSYFISYSRVRL